MAEPYTAPGGIFGGRNAGQNLRGGANDGLRDIFERFDDKNNNLISKIITNIGTTPTPIRNILPWTSKHDDFGAYEDGTFIDGHNGWTSGDTYDNTGWKTGTAVIDTMDGAEHNYLSFEPSEIPAEGFTADSNHATYHVSSDDTFDTLAVSFYQKINMNGGLKVEVSGNNGLWVDVSKLLQLKKGTSENDSRYWEAYADLTSLISAAQITKDVYLRFSSEASSDTFERSFIVDPAIYRNHLIGVSRDDFASFEDQEAINGKGGWASDDVYHHTGWLAEAGRIKGVDHNIIHFHPEPWPGDGGGFALNSNYATYHVASAQSIEELALSTDYYVMPRSDMKAYISGDNVNWVDITDELGIHPSEVEDDWKNGFADLTSYLSAANVLNDFYIKFTAAAYSDTGWGIGLGNIEVTKGDIERALIRNELRDILELNTLAQLDDYAIRNQDTQGGFVMTDIHGNRVRVAQYMFMPDSNDPADTTVKLVNINYRGTEAGDLSGLTTMEYLITFNKKPPEDPEAFKNLPWGDYFRTIVFDATEEGLKEKPYNEWGTGDPGNERGAIVHCGTPEYWPTKFMIHVVNPHDDYVKVTEAYEDMTDPLSGELSADYFRKYMDSEGGLKQAYIQLEDESLGGIAIGKAGAEIFNHTWEELSPGNGFYASDGICNYVQDPLHYLTDYPRFSDTYWLDKDDHSKGKIRTDFSFYIIDADGTRTPRETVYTDTTHTATTTREFRIYSVRDILNGRSAQNLEVVFNCDDGELNPLITAPIDVVIPQGASDAESEGRTGILRLYDNHEHTDEGGEAE